MKVAIVHDYLNQAGGAERVVGALHRLFPAAPIYTTIADPTVIQTLLPGADVRTSWMQRLPGLKRHYRKYFLLYPHAIEHFDLSEYDLVVSNSTAYAKGAIVRPDACHVCYCHTPMRFAWNFEGYAAREQWGPITRRILPPLISRLRRWDVKTIDRVTYYIGNSSAVAARISRLYGRAAAVVHPPVEVERLKPSAGNADYHLVVSRLVAYKRVDLVIEAFNQLRRPLTVIGDGPARAQLERMAGPTIRFLGRRPDPEVAEHYARCRAVLFPGEEDFGIVPLEANASGRPVIAYAAGGALDTVIEGRTGVFFKTQAADAVINAVRACDQIVWDKQVLREHAEGFREAAFRIRFIEAVAAALDQNASRLASESVYLRGRLATQPGREELTRGRGAQYEDAGHLMWVVRPHGCVP